jgi:hypothetical protein
VTHRSRRPATGDPSLPPTGLLPSVVPPSSSCRRQTLPTAEVDLREGRSAARKVGTTTSTRSSPLKCPSSSAIVFSLVSQHPRPSLCHILARVLIHKSGSRYPILGILDLPKGSFLLLVLAVVLLCTLME